MLQTLLSFADSWLGNALTLAAGIAFHVAMIVTFRAFACRADNRRRWAAGTLVLMVVFLGLFFLRVGERS